MNPRLPHFTTFSFSLFLYPVFQYIHIFIFTQWNYRFPIFQEKSLFAITAGSTVNIILRWIPFINRVQFAFIIRRHEVNKTSRIKSFFDFFAHYCLPPIVFVVYRALLRLYHHQITFPGNAFSNATRISSNLLSRYVSAKSRVMAGIP